VDLQSARLLAQGFVFDSRRRWRLDEVPLNVLQASERGVGKLVEGGRGEVKIVGLASTTAIEGDNINRFPAIRSADPLAAYRVVVGIPVGGKRVEELPPNSNHVVRVGAILTAGTQSDVKKGTIARKGITAAGRRGRGGSGLRRRVSVSGSRLRGDIRGDIRGRRRRRLDRQRSCRIRGRLRLRSNVDGGIRDGIAASGGNRWGGRGPEGSPLKASFSAGRAAGNRMIVGLTCKMVVACCQRRAAYVEDVRSDEGRNRRREKRGDDRHGEEHHDSARARGAEEKRGKTLGSQRPSKGPFGYLKTE